MQRLKYSHLRYGPSFPGNHDVFETLKVSYITGYFPETDRSKSIGSKGPNSIWILLEAALKNA
jgi:hypothetical protein